MLWGCGECSVYCPPPRPPAAPSPPPHPHPPPSPPPPPPEPKVDAVIPGAGTPLGLEGFFVGYPLVLAAFRGDWWDAAQVYRPFALGEASWTRKVLCVCCTHLRQKETNQVLFVYGPCDITNTKSMTGWQAPSLYTKELVIPQLTCSRGERHGGGVDWSRTYEKASGTF